MGLWDGIEDAELRGQGVYLDVGFIGVVKVLKTLAMLTENVGLAFIVELQLVETNMPEKYPVGMQVTWFQKMIDPKVAFPAVTRWAAACKGYDNAEDIKRDISPYIKDVMNYATEHPDANGFIGDLVRIEVVPHTTKKKIEIGIYRFKSYQSMAATG
jgi:hypothetical protein